MYAARWRGITAAKPAAASLLAALVAAGLLGWLAVGQRTLAILLAAGVCAIPLGIAARLSVRGWVIALVLVGHLVGGPLYIQGFAHNSFSVALDVLAVLAFGLLAFEPQSPRRPWRMAVLALAALVVAQAFNPILPSVGYGLTAARAIVVPLLLLVAVGSGRLNPRDERVLVALAVIGWTVNVVLAGRQLLVGFTGAELSYIRSSRATYLVGEQIRLIGATRTNQDFAFLVAIAFPAVCACAAAPGVSRRWRVGFTVLALATVGVLFGSLVRSGLVGGAAGALGAIAVMTRTSHARWRVAMYGVGLALVVWLVASFGLGLALSPQKAQTLQNRVSSIFSPGNDYAFQQRQQTVWPHVVHEIGVYPLGAGAGSAGPVSQAQEDAPLGALVPDNGYLLMAVQFGLPGLVLFLLTLGLLASELWRNTRRGALAAAAGFGALVALCAAMVTGNFVSLVSPSCAFAVIVGLGLRANAGGVGLAVRERGTPPARAIVAVASA